jgi:riboflavin synthase
MFTGIVEEVGTVRSAGTGRMVVGASKVLADLKVGDSVCVNGTCLTATSTDDTGFTVDVVPETLRRTNLGSLTAGDPVNLERSMAIGDRFGGHIVQGHIDATGEVASIDTEAEALVVSIRAPVSVMRYVVEKGFVAVDGTSLTVVNCGAQSFTVTIIPHTRDNTVFGSRRVGDLVNLEADIIAKYVERVSSGPRLPVDIADEL